MDIDDLFFSYLLLQPRQIECPLAPTGSGGVIHSKNKCTCKGKKNNSAVTHIRSHYLSGLWSYRAQDMGSFLLK